MQNKARSIILGGLDFLYFGGSLFYMETVFCWLTGGNLWGMHLLFYGLFGVVYGGLSYLLATLFSTPWLRRTLSTLLLSLPAIAFLIEYFVWQKFKVLYDLNTVTGGAGGVVSDYKEEILATVCSLSGLTKILLFFLPAVLYLTVSLLLPFLPRLTWRRRLCEAGLSVTCYALCLALILGVGSYRKVYRTQYEFATAVEQFGLLTGLRLDGQRLLFGSTAGSFEPPSLPPTPTDTPQEAPTYGEHKMELDFTKPANSAITELNQYVKSLTPAKENQYTGLFAGKNLILITAEAFTAEVIHPTRTPTLYRMATKGIQFTDYYQPSTAGTTGGEYQNIFGMLPTNGGMSFKDTANNLNYFTMGSQLSRLNYYGKAFHNNSYTYYDRHKTHVNLGYSDGFLGMGNGMETYVTNAWPQSDLEMIAGTLPTYVDRQPFSVYYMSVSGHSNYTSGSNAMSQKNWQTVETLPYSQPVRGYLAANQELENAMAHLVAQLEEKGIADDTVICISTDHFPYGLDEQGSLGKMPYLSELFGYPVTSLFQRDHSALIVWSGCLEKQSPLVVDTPTSSLDILPTLSNLFGTQYDSRLMVGRDVFSSQEALVFNLNYSWKTELGTYEKGVFTPADHTVNIPDGYVERIQSVVRNKIRFCDGVLNEDYFRYLFE